MTSNNYTNMGISHGGRAENDYGDTLYPPDVISPPLYNAFSSGGRSSTPATSIETSPLSMEHYSPANAASAAYVNKKNNHRVYNGSHHDHDHAYVKSQRQRHISSHDRQKAMGHQQHGHNYNPSLKIDRFDSYRKEMKNEQNKRKSNNTHMSQRLNTLTWRMDPSESLSDYTLVVLGINDEEAVKQRNTKVKGKTKHSRRKDKWMVEGLYLDASHSYENNDECCNDDHDKEGKRGNEKDEYLNYTFTSSITGKPYSLTRSSTTARKANASNYPARKEYHLHKANLAVGPRSCDYFSRLFRRKQQQTAHGNSTHQNNHHSIELPMSSLSAIPAMLDYIYSTDGSTPIHATTDTAVPLRYLATIFGNRSLFDAATEFLQRDLRPESCIPYLNHADLYRQKKLSEVCVRLCAEEFDQIKIRWLAMLPPHLVEEILYSKYFRSSSSHAVCAKIASYCRCQENNIDGSTLSSLTDVRVMPQILPDEALFFIKFIISLGMDMEDDDNFQNGRSLYERCIDASPSIVQAVIDSLCHGRSTEGNRRQQKNACGEYSQLPPQIKVDLLEYALAKQQHGEIGMEYLNP